jgi:hypothetical protein
MIKTKHSKGKAAIEARSAEPVSQGCSTLSTERHGEY